MTATSKDQHIQPEIVNRVFIIGSHRSGTTYLTNVLAEQNDLYPNPIFALAKKPHKSGKFSWLHFSYSLAESLHKTHAKKRVGSAGLGIL